MCWAIHDVIGWTTEWDITKPEAKSVIADIHPAWVVHAAAWTDVDGCERDPDRAYLVNGEGTRRVAEGCHAVGGMVYLSTDYVFDGQKGAPCVETDPAAPLSVYDGRNWLARGNLRDRARWAIVRTAWFLWRSARNL
jgi:dTDP-4-dehydrorhamnose reductase